MSIYSSMLWGEVLKQPLILPFIRTYVRTSVIRRITEGRQFHFARGRGSQKILSEHDHVEFN
jgi:hypothetical protein